jgi:CubicO group peptidase (beta-lactamase class C family)
MVLECCMSHADEAAADALVARLPAWCHEFGVPGGGLVCWQRGRRSATFCGIADVRSGAPVQEDTRFNLGSIVKLYTATMCLQGVQRGVLNLDRPLQADWPELPLPGPWASQITLRHLLTHQGGFEGDVFDDMGTGADALARFAAHCQGLPAPFSPGEVYSYSNVGYALLGRLLELLHGTDWDTALQRTLAQPLGLVDTGTPFVPAQRLGPTAMATAIGHGGSAGAWQVIDNLRFLRSNGPCGATATATVDDLARFGLLHLQAAAGQGPLLAARHHAAMCRRAVRVPCPNGWTAFGLGVMHFEVDDSDGDILGHNGAIDGVWTFLRFVPRLDLVMALMVNGGDATGLVAALNEAAFPALGPARPSRPPELPAVRSKASFTAYLGRYGSDRYHVDVTAAGTDGGVMARFVPSAAARDFGAPYEVMLEADEVATQPGRFIGRMPGSSVASYQAFLPRGTDPAGILNFRGRALPRLSESPVASAASVAPV